MTARPPSLSRRLVAGALLWIAAAIAAGGYFLSYAFARSTEAGFDARLESLVLALLAAIEVDESGRVFLARPLGEPRFEQVLSGWYWQVDDASGTLLRSRSLWDRTLEGGDRGRIVGPDGATLRVAARAASLPGREIPLRFRVAASDEEIDAETKRFTRLLVVSLGLLGAGLAAAVLVQVSYGLRPLRRLEADLERVRAGARRRLPDAHPREVASLAAEMNRVLDHDQAQIERARHHLGDLAHALKTPLSVARAELVGDAPPDRALLLEQATRMERLVQHHLARAAAAGAASAGRGAVEIAPVAGAVSGALRRIHALRAIEVEADVPDGLAFHGERHDLEEIVGNLADNACKWARSRVRVLAAAVEDGVRIVVEDDGPGLDPASAELATARGTRLDETSPGTGLGLAIVRDLVALYGGTLRFGSAALGGLEAEVRLPGGVLSAERRGASR